VAALFEIATPRKIGVSRILSGTCLEQTGYIFRIQDARIADAWLE
jgi:hypothetical protein